MTLQETVDAMTRTDWNVELVIVDTGNVHTVLKTGNTTRASLIGNMYEACIDLNCIRPHSWD